MPSSPDPNRRPDHEQPGDDENLIILDQRYPHLEALADALADLTIQLTAYLGVNGAVISAKTVGSDYVTPLLRARRFPAPARRPHRVSEVKWWDDAAGAWLPRS